MTQTVTLPGLDCGLCGYRLCNDLAVAMVDDPSLLQRCVHLSGNVTHRDRPLPVLDTRSAMAGPSNGEPDWHDSLGREFDFFLEHLPEDPGPRETIIPHNPMITREMEIRRGDLLIGRPLGMSCGCPITHCGVVTDVEPRSGVITWCVTGPLAVRQQGYKDLGYYSAEAYDGLVRTARSDIRIGMRYFFQPRMCMLQWRHSGLVNFINRTPQGLRIRLEGLWIG